MPFFSQRGPAASSEVADLEDEDVQELAAWWQEYMDAANQELAAAQQRQADAASSSEQQQVPASF
jgi:hypothetical protein